MTNKTKDVEFNDSLFAEAISVYRETGLTPRQLIGNSVKLSRRLNALQNAASRLVQNIERWIETGVPADAEESKSIYDQLKSALPHEIIIRERETVIEHNEIMKIIEERAKQIGWTSAELIQEYLKIAVKTLKDTKLI